MRLSRIVGNISEGIAKHWLDRDPYIKFLGGYGVVTPTRERSLFQIPGYCTKLSDIVQQWGTNGGINVPYDGNLYAVHVNAEELWPLPKWVNNIVGYAGPPTHKIPMEVLSQIWNLPDCDDAVDKLEDMGVSTQWGQAYRLRHNSITHDVIRSVVPGVYNTGLNGYRSEIIVNVPCRMDLISLYDREDESSGYLWYNIE